MTDAELKVLSDLWQDCRSLIAALKVQRWDVCKWTITVNLSITAASIALHSSHWVFGCAAFGVAGLGVFLTLAYNRRITGVRGRLTAVIQHINDNVFDFSAKIGVDVGKKKGADHDRDEMIGFLAAIFASVIPSLVVWAS